MGSSPAPRRPNLWTSCQARFWGSQKDSQIRSGDIRRTYPVVTCRRRVKTSDGSEGPTTCCERCTAQVLRTMQIHLIVGVTDGPAGSARIGKAGLRTDEVILTFHVLNLEARDADPHAVQRYFQSIGSEERRVREVNQIGV